MSGKKSTSGNKKCDVKPKEISSEEVQHGNGGTEKENIPVIITDHQVQSKPPIPEPKSKPSVKRRFSFGKGKKKNYDATNGATKKNASIRRSHSLSLFNRSDGQSRLPMFRQKTTDKNGKRDVKAMSTSRLQIATSYESRSLVLNPGMDSWRMAGLIDTVGKMNSDMALNNMKHGDSSVVYMPTEGNVEDHSKVCFPHTV